MIKTVCQTQQETVVMAGLQQMKPHLVQEK
jgi:hypothetical protein